MTTRHYNGLRETTQPPHLELSDPMGMQRWAPEVPFPPYSYVPGLFPHPISAPEGHRFALPGHFALPAHDGPSLSGAAVLESEVMLAAVDLFNHGYYWEAHECWEQLWVAVGRKGPAADLLKGLIKLAAAGVKARQSSREGVVRHARRAAELLRLAAAEPCVAQRLNRNELIVAAQRLSTAPDRYVTTSTELVVVVFDFVVEPRRSVE